MKITNNKRIFSDRNKSREHLDIELQVGIKLIVCISRSMFNNNITFALKITFTTPKLSRCYTNQTGKEMVLWFAKFVCGRRSHEAECCVSSGLIKGRVISLIINSPQKGHSLAIASSSSDRSLSAVVVLVTGSSDRLPFISLRVSLPSNVSCFCRSSICSACSSCAQLVTCVIRHCAWKECPQGKT